MEAFRIKSWRVVGGATKLMAANVEARKYECIRTLSVRNARPKVFEKVWADAAIVDSP